MNKVMSTIFGLLVVVSSGCQKEAPGDGSSSSSSSSSGAPLIEGTPLLEFSSLVSGDYPLYSNTKIDDLTIGFPLMASFFDIIRLEKSDELDTFVAESQTNGFAKEQFDVLYAASIEVIQGLRGLSTFDLTGGLGLVELIREEDGFLGKFKLTIDDGLRGKDRIFTYSIKDSISLDGCDKGPEVCDIALDVVVSISFPTKNPTFELTDGAISPSFIDMNINAQTFKVSNSLASLDLALKPDSTFVLNYGMVLVEDGLGDFNYAASTLWTHPDTQMHIDVKGEFTNTFIDENDTLQEFKITGAAVGAIDDMQFEACYRESDVCPEDLDAASVTGSMEGANVSIDFAAEIVE